MAEVTATQVSALRKSSGAGMMDAKRALEQAQQWREWAEAAEGAVEEL